MTTWAYRNGVLAVDSKSVIMDDEKFNRPAKNKLVVRKFQGEYIAFTGNGNACLKHQIIEWYLTGQPVDKTPEKSIGISGLEKDTTLFVAKTDYGKYYRHPQKDWQMVLRDFRKFAVGGSEYHPAMYFGNYLQCNAIEIVARCIEAGVKRQKKLGKDVRKTDTDWPIHYWMPGWKEYKVITKSDWKSNKKELRRLGK